MTEKEILVQSYRNAENLDFATIGENIKKDIDVLIENIDSNKSLVVALVTSLVKKIYTPNQDIRLHRADFDQGYSARVLDTKVTVPFFKDYFPKYANKESAFLTLAIRERIKWTKEEGSNLKIRNKRLKESFLNIFEQIQVENANPQDYLNYIFAKLMQLSKVEEMLFNQTSLQSLNMNGLNINLILTMLQQHFESKLSSRLPVVAIYSMYEILMPKLDRYKDKKLMPLQVHTASDRHSFGDIEIYTEENKPFEIIEIKHNIPIDKYLIFDLFKKIQNIKIYRYYILTTFADCFANVSIEQEVTDYILELKKQSEIDIIANGIMTTLKYSLRFIDDYNEFITVYTKNLILDAKNSTEIKNFHLEKWAEICKSFTS